MVSVRELTYLIHTGGECGIDVTARTKFVYVMFWECGKLLYETTFVLRVIEIVYRDDVRKKILYGSEAWFLKENKMGIL